MWAQVGAVCILYTAAVDGEAFVPRGGWRGGEAGEMWAQIGAVCILYTVAVDGETFVPRGGGGWGGRDVGTSRGCMYSVHCGSGR